MLWIIGGIAVVAAVIGVVVWRMDWDHDPSDDERDRWFR